MKTETTPSVPISRLGRMLANHHDRILPSITTTTTTTTARSMMLMGFSGAKPRRDDENNSKFFSGAETKDGLREFLAGAGSGLIAKTLEYPFDTVKVLQQTQRGFNGPLDAAVKTIKAHGVMSLLRGITAPALGGCFENAVVFGSYGSAGRNLFGIDEDSPTWASRWTYAASGGVAGVLAATMLTPLERLKSVMQVMDAKKRLGTLAPQDAFSGPWDVAQRILKDTGISGLYRGYAACLLREIPGNAAWFGVYEAAVRSTQEHMGFTSRAEVPLYMKGLAGSLGGLCYWVVPYPFDTVKTLLQVDSRFTGWSVPMVMKKVHAESGFRGLYKGLGITLFRAAPEHFLLFMLFEWIDDTLHQY